MTTILTSALDNTYGADYTATMAQAVKDRLIELDPIAAINPHYMEYYQQAAYDHFGITPDAFYTDVYYDPAIADDLTPTERNAFAGDFDLLEDRLDELFA